MSRKRRCPICGGSMEGRRKDAEVCSNACRTEKSRRAAQANPAVTEDEFTRLVERASKHPEADRDLLHRSKMAVARCAVLTTNSDLGEFARLGGRIQKLARRLAAYQALEEKYGKVSRG